MRPILVLLLFLTGLLTSNRLHAQRGHEIQFQFGVRANKGVSFYNYIESPELRHNFEFDQRHNTTVLHVNWSHPINGYLDAGVFYTHSLSSTLRLLEAESILFDSNNPGIRRPSDLFLGLTELRSTIRELGAGLRINMVRTDKFRVYSMIQAGVQRIAVRNAQPVSLEVVDEELRKDLLQTYRLKERLFTIGYGFGLSYYIRNGLNLRILEIHGKTHPHDSDLLSAATSVEIKTGFSYQLYKRR